MKKKYFYWMMRETQLLDDRKVLFVGGTGSIGYCALTYLAFLKAEIVLAARNIDKANLIKEKLLKEYPDTRISIAKLDISSLSSIDDFISSHKEERYDYVINNAGVYHLPKQDSVDGIEIHFATTCVGNGYFLEKILPSMNEYSKIIITSSMSVNFYNFRNRDYENRTDTHKLKQYSLSKRAMHMNTLYIKRHLDRNDVEINLCHPGIVATELMKKGYSKLFMHTIFPLMKIFFHSPNKAALTIIKAMFSHPKLDQWISPRGLFSIWGYPKRKKINPSLLDEKKQDEIHAYIENLLNNKLNQN